MTFEKPICKNSCIQERTTVAQEARARISNFRKHGGFPRSPAVFSLRQCTLLATFSTVET